MSTTMEETKMALNPDAVRQYIEAGREYDDTIGDSTGYLPGEYRLLAKRYQDRVEAKRALDTELPELDRLASESERIAREASAPLADEVTVGEVRERVRILLDIRVDTHHEMAEACEVLDRHANQLRGKANEARGLADALRNRAERLLFETCLVVPCPTLQALARRRETLGQQIEGHRETVRIAEHVLPGQRAFVEAIGRGEIVPPVCRSHGQPRTSSIEREFLVSERGKLQQLAARAAGRDAALAAISACEQELVDLEPKLQAAAEAQVARKLNPAAMKWSPDDSCL